MQYDLALGLKYKAGEEELVELIQKANAICRQINTEFSKILDPLISEIKNTITVVAPTDPVKDLIGKGKTN